MERKKGDWIKKLNIDWTNHFIAFLATVIGIIIAFSLEDWNDSRKEKEAVHQAMNSLKSELKSNFEIINNNLNRLPKFTGLNRVILKYRISDIPDDLKVILVCSKNQFDSLRQIYQNEISEESIIQKAGDSKITFYTYWDGFFPERLNFDNWEAVKSSGLLYKFKHGQMITINRVYSHLQRNPSGVSEDDIVLMQVQDKKLNLDLFDEKIGSFRFSNEMKLSFTDSDYKSILTY